MMRTLDNLSNTLGSHLFDQLLLLGCDLAIQVSALALLEPAYGREGIKQLSCRCICAAFGSHTGPKDGQ